MPNGALWSRGRGRASVEAGPTPAPWRSAPTHYYTAHHKLDRFRCLVASLAAGSPAGQRPRTGAGRSSSRRCLWLAVAAAADVFEGLVDQIGDTGLVEGGH